MTKAAEDNQAFAPPEEVTEMHIVEEFQRLIEADATKTVYISSLCGRFLQRYKKPVTAIINNERPADFLRRYPDIFVMTGGGHVGARRGVLELECLDHASGRLRVASTVRGKRE